jgi:uncharacterized protein (DUF58 family)
VTGYRPSRPRPTARGVGALGVFLGLLVVALSTGTAQLAALTVAVGLPLAVAPFAASLRARRARSALAVSASVSPAMSVVGGDVGLRIAVTNRSARPAPALSVGWPSRQWRRRGTESSAPPLPRLVPSGLISLAGLAPRHSATFVGAVPSGRRGVFDLPPSPSWILDPFGLFGAPGPVIPAVCAVFYPAADGAPRRSAETGGTPTDGPAAPLPEHGRDGAGELVGIRPYVAGDRLSLLHWPARARYGAWFVRQFAPEVGQRTRLVLDDRAGVHRRADFETMLAGAHGLLERCYEDGATVELSTMSGTSATLAPVPLGLEEARVLLAGVLPRRWRADQDMGGGTVITTATGARSLPDGVERIVVGS